MNDLFFIFSKILTVLLFPLPLVIIVTISMIVFGKGKYYKILSILPILFLWILSSFPVSQWLVRSLEDEYPPIPIEQVSPSEIIVVLGGAVNILGKHRDRVELGSSAERLTDGILLYRNKKAPIILFTGGSGILFQQNFNEAFFAKKFFNDFEISDRNLLLEDKSKNTYENALYTKEILSKLGKNKIILITSAFHMKRSLGVFLKQGFDVQSFPTDYKSMMDDLNWDTILPSTMALDASTIAIKEWIGIIVYHLKGYI
jgi:uncharacterized SAM-binding protein YcdF (DUF218 family)